MQTYRLPHTEETVEDLVPESSEGQALTASTTVLVRHRGRHLIVDKFDGRDYPIRPGLTYMPYGAALHFQARAVIPGTRNPEVGSQQSYLGIVGIDSPELCEPLTDEEIAHYGASVEAIDRSALSDPNDRQTSVIKSGVIARGGRGNVKKPQISASDDAVFEKPGITDAQRDAAESGGSLGEVNKRVKRGG
jgi:hypothetical protein